MGALAEPDQLAQQYPHVAKAIGAPGKQLSQAQVLLALAEAANAELWHDDRRTAYVTLPVGGHQETWPVRSRDCRLWLTRAFHKQQGKPPAAEAMQGALATLESKALFDGEEYPTFLRVGRRDGIVYLDLCDKDWRAVKITPTGWTVVTAPPIRFRRSKGMLALPAPERGGSIEQLRHYVRTQDDDDWRLLVAWLVAALHPAGPYPVLVAQGEQGSGKSSTARLLKALVDPYAAALRGVPNDLRDLAIAANNSWCLAYDNLSGVGGWLSDALCRLSTGGGFATRELYTDDTEVIFDSKRPVILTGIDAVVERQDLVDRSLILTLPSIPDNERKPEKELWAQFEQDRPKILGALLDAVSMALRRQDSVHLERLPRMADFAIWATAAEPALGWEVGTFLRAYDGNRREAVQTSLDADPVGASVQRLMEQQPVWTGTATQLYKACQQYVSDEVQRTRAWPKAPNKFSSRLKMAATFLRQTGITITWPDHHGGAKTLRVERVAEVSSQSSQPSQRASSAGFGGDDTLGVSSQSSPVSSPRKQATSAGWDDRDDRDDRKPTLSGDPPLPAEERETIIL